MPGTTGLRTPPVPTPGMRRIHPPPILRRLVALAVAVPAALALSAGASHAQVLSGRLLEEGNDRPIDLGYLVLLSESGDTVAITLSDAGGQFNLVAPGPGSFYLSGSGLGYQQATVGVFDLGLGGAMTVEFRLKAVPLALGGLTVESQQGVPLAYQHPLVANGFVERAQTGRGRFLTPRDIERAQAMRTEDLLQTTGRVLVMANSGNSATNQIVMRGPKGNCVPDVVVDGMPVTLAPGMPIESVAPVRELSAAEVYRSPSEAPVQLGGTWGRNCGLIVLWTRDPNSMRRRLPPSFQ